MPLSSSSPPLSRSSVQEHNSTPCPRTDVKDQYKALGLTGNVISAVACIPYIAKITVEDNLELAPRSYIPLLYQALARESTSTGWNHSIIAWTGEVLPTSGNEHVPLPDLDRLQLRPENGKDLSNGATGNWTGYSDLDNIPSLDRQAANLVQRDLLITKPHRQELERLLQQHANLNILPVWLGEWLDGDSETLLLEEQGKWTQYAENSLKPTLCSMPRLDPDDESLTASFANYRKMNESVADAILSVYKPGDIVWIHNYPLMLLPAILRHKIPSASIIYSHPIGWCPQGDLKELPHHQEIAKGVSGASVVSTPGFADYQDMRTYYQDTQLPLGINLNYPEDPKPLDATYRWHLAETSRVYAQKRLVFVRFWSDKFNEVSLLLNGVEHFLKHKLERKGSVSFFLIAYSGNLQSSAATLPAQKLQCDEELRPIITTINAKFGSLPDQPVVCLGRYVSREQDIALLRSADLGIVIGNQADTPDLITDWMICHEETAKPVLIPETFTSGTDTQAVNLPCSFQLSDPVDIATKIHECLTMDEASKHRHRRCLSDHLDNYLDSTYASRFLARACSALTQNFTAQNIPSLNLESLSQVFSQSSKRLIMFDYDGTLTPIINDPDAAIPTNTLLEAIRELTQDEGTRLWIISGRSRVFLEKHFGHLMNLGLSAEHGSFIRRPGQSGWANLAMTMDMGWKTEVEKVLGPLVDTTEASWIERKEVAIVWHYRNATDHDACFAKAVEAKALLEIEKLKGWDVEVMLGKANLEIRPRFLNKGALASTLITETFGQETDGFVLCAGDDTTDEGKCYSSIYHNMCANNTADMFRALLRSKLNKENIFSCLVAKEHKPTLAYYRIDEPADLVNVVAALSSQKDS